MLEVFTLCLVLFNTIVNGCLICMVFLPYLDSIYNNQYIALFQRFNMSWQNKARALYYIACLYIKQWLDDSVKQVSPGVYELTHLIDGDVVKLLIKHRDPEIVDVYNEDREDSCITKEKPYLLYTPIPWTPAYKATVYFDDGTTQSY